MRSERDFWSRRRAAVEDEARQEAAATEAREAARTEAELESLPEEQVLAELGLPAPESVASGEDMRAFMAKAVPDYLRRRALRTLWRSNPVLACVDGLNDYDGDFTNAATDAPGVKTAYQVGKGLKAHVDYLAEQARARAAAEDAVPAEMSDVVADPVPVRPPEAPVRTALVDVPDGAEAVDDGAEAVDDTVDPDIVDDAEVPRPRRMAFRFDGEDA